MSMTRWDPFREMMTLREAMQGLFEDSYVAPRGTQGMMGGNLPVDVHEAGDQFVVTAAMPGVKPDDVEISVLGDTLRIRGEINQGEPPQPDGDERARQNAQEQRGPHGQPGRWIVRERWYGAFERILTLPTSVKADQAQARFEHGVLTLTLPKAEEAKPRAIKINAQPAIAGGATESDAPQATGEDVQVAR